MARSPHQAAAAPALLPLALLILIATSFLPHRFSTPWVTKIVDQATLVFTPISQLGNSVGQAFVNIRKAEDLDPRAAEEQIDQLRSAKKQLEERVRMLTAQLDEISRGRFLLPDLPIRTVLRPVISPGGRLMRVRGGEDEDLTRDTIATAGYSQIVGKIERVEARTSLILPITSKEMGRLDARVLYDPNSSAGRVCQLTPLGDGTLEGECEGETAENQAQPLQIGQTVVLDQPERWPAHAQMLVIGIVESVQDHPATSLRKIITVRPTVPVRRISQVYLRTPDTSEQAGGTE